MQMENGRNSICCELYILFLFLPFRLLFSSFAIIPIVHYLHSDLCKIYTNILLVPQLQLYSLTSLCVSGDQVLSALGQAERYEHTPLDRILVNSRLRSVLMNGYVNNSRLKHRRLFAVSAAGPLS